MCDLDMGDLEKGGSPPDLHLPAVMKEDSAGACNPFQHMPASSSMPPLHRWLLDISGCNSPSHRAAVQCFLDFPEQPLQNDFSAQHLRTISKHVLACIAFCKQLA